MNFFKKRCPSSLEKIVLYFKPKQNKKTSLYADVNESFRCIASLVLFLRLINKKNYRQFGGFLRRLIVLKYVSNVVIELCNFYLKLKKVNQLFD